MSIVLHPSNEALLASYAAHPPQGIILSGQEGVGLGTIASHLAGKGGMVSIRPTNSKGETDAKAGTISIESIRNLYEQTRAKQTAHRFVIIDDADRMSHGAQTALLKLLEEPPKYVHFILTSHTPEAIMPTIRSRVQTITIKAITDDQTKEFISKLGVTDGTKQAQIKYVADGLPAELHRLATDEAYFKEKSTIMSDTKVLLSGSAYEKLLLINKYHRNKSATLQLLSSALLVVKRSVTSRPNLESINQLDRLLKAQEKITANRNPRLQLMSLVL